VTRLASILALALSTPALGAGLTTGTTPTEDAASIAEAASIAALDALRTPPLIAPWSPLIEVPPIDPVGNVLVQPVGSIATGAPDWVYGLPLLALVPVVLDGGMHHNQFATDLPVPSTPQQPGLPDVPVPSVPEPATWAMMLLGFLSLGVMMRRNRKVFA